MRIRIWTICVLLVATILPNAIAFFVRMGSTLIDDPGGGRFGF